MHKKLWIAEKVIYYLFIRILNLILLWYYTYKLGFPVFFTFLTASSEGKAMPQNFAQTAVILGVIWLCLFIGQVFLMTFLSTKLEIFFIKKNAKYDYKRSMMENIQASSAYEKT